MKIAILTFSQAFSTGALLQCYALATFLQKEGHTVKLLKSNLKVENSWIYYLNSITRCANFRHFRKQFLPPNANKDESFDLYIVGSDQVWNPDIPVKPLDYFFSFLPSTAKRISYAASFGMENWDYNDEFTQQVKNCLQRFSYITVREDSAVNICNDVFGCHADLVVDPTLLLGDFENLYSCSLATNSTLFYYRVSHKDNWGNLVDEIANDLNLTVSQYLPKKRFSFLPIMCGLNTIYPSIQEWLNAVRSSSFILTDSFHTVVFAILNRKPFIVLPSVKSRMGRIVSLLSRLGIINRYFSTIEEARQRRIWNEVIDYDSVFLLLTKLQENSNAMLKNICNKI
ncbi:polysaccharide pyruvyl transferase family protein [Bacteroides fluxus]|uniref:polysaccharide pyruvyl transferase family protein n=1 Tax=Bacteroides fluxus TaxID=626930 RepID=UPI00266C9097|nr:polysaccharide pyruvyl transferase family protein [Bacteroides fluxus]